MYISNTPQLISTSLVSNNCLNAVNSTNTAITSVGGVISKRELSDIDKEKEKQAR